ncbi:acyltransferase [uncultured Pseudoalteromonas sp.]|uniref:acyltransferase n=1 Tax=uncultured Pseudoalteromonas sp. TaxID=114053 RepID=UPI002593AB1F|nr:acyltransferase [uncultured Pseudoalteromonas sp.]
MNGRKLFKKFKYVFVIINFMLRLLPKFIRRFLFNISASIPFKIGVAIRYVIFKSLVKKCGYNVYIARWCVFKDIDELEVGDNVSFHEYFYLDGQGKITIGDDVSFAHSCSLISFEHSFSDKNIKIKYQPIILKPIYIESDVWFGCGVRVLGGSSIGERTVIAANSVTKGCLEKNAIYAGLPAREIKKI